MCGGGGRGESVEGERRMRNGRREGERRGTSTATIKNCSHVDTNIPPVVTLT